MAIRKISQLGNPVLRRKGRSLTPEEINTPAIQQLIDDMFETLEDIVGAGLAAPQVYESLQLAIVDIKPTPHAPNRPRVSGYVLINPEIVDVGDPVVEDWEGCLSFVDLVGKAPRHHSVTVRALDRYGKPFELKAEGFHARAIQHEYDHLQGHVYVDRITDIRTLMKRTEYERYWLGHKDFEGES